MKSFISVLTSPQKQMKESSSWISIFYVILALIMAVFLKPLLELIIHGSMTPLEPMNVVLQLITGMLSFLIICIIIWFVGKCFGSTSTLILCISKWGITFPPTILCTVIIVLVNVYYYMFWQNMLFAILLNCAFVGILLWKAVLDVMYLQIVIQLEGWKITFAFIIFSVIQILIGFVGSIVGLLGLMV